MEYLIHIKPIFIKLNFKISILSLYWYAHLLLTSKLNQAKVEEIREKIKVDLGLLKETYKGLAGKNLTVSTIKNHNDFHDF